MTFQMNCENMPSTSASPGRMGSGGVLAGTADESVETCGFDPEMNATFLPN